MTTQKLFSETRERKPFSARRGVFRPSYFLHALRSSWPRAVCYFLIVFLALPIPLLISVTMQVRMDAVPALSVGEMVAKDFSGAQHLYGMLAAALGIMAGMLAVTYLYNKVSVDCYHSLPLCRTGLLIHGFLVGFCDFFVALAANGLLAQLILSIKVDDVHGFGATAGVVVGICGVMLLTFLFFFTLAILCGMLAGTAFGQLMVGGTFLGWLPLMVYGLPAMLDNYMTYVDIRYYVNEWVDWDKISPLLRIGSLVDKPFSAGEVILWIGLSVLFFVIAVFLYRIRRVERAGLPIVFGAFGTVLKYMLMTLVTLGCGGLFRLIARDGWMVFGFVFGGFVSFLLLNAILYKNPRQMFRGIFKLGIFLVVFCLVFAGLVLFCTRVVDKQVPEERHVSSVELSFYGNNYRKLVYDDPEIISLAVRAVEKSYYVSSHVDSDGPLSYMSFTFRVGGFPVSYRSVGVTAADMKALSLALCQTELLRETLLPDEALVDGQVWLNGRFIDMLGTYRNIESPEMTAEMLAALRSDVRDVGFYEIFQYPEIGEMYLTWESNSGNVTLPLTLGMERLLGLLGFGTSQEICRTMAEYMLVTGDSVYDSVAVRRGDAEIVLDSAEDVERLAELLSCVDFGSGASTIPYTAVDGTYDVLFRSRGVTRYVSYSFIDGKVPAFIRSALG